MRIASLIILLLQTSHLAAGFAVTPASTESANISYGSIESHTLPVKALVPKDLHETLSRSAVKLASSYLEIINGTLTILSTQVTTKQFGVAKTRSGIHYTLSAPKAKSVFNPDDLRLDFYFDINGVDLGGLGSVSGSPTGNGRQGIVRIDGMSGRKLAEHFEPPPFIELLYNSSNRSNEDVEVSYAQQFACLLFVVAAFLSSLRSSQQLQHQQQLQRRRLQRQARQISMPPSPAEPQGASPRLPQLPAGQP